MKQGHSGEPRHLEIRKYSNRRFYDTTRSRHLTLEQIRSLVRDGCAVRITDSKTGADITAQILTQIILELETPKIAAIPVSLLAQLIRLNEQMISQMTGKYPLQPFAAWLEYQKQMEENFRHFQRFQSLYSPLAPWAGMESPAASGNAAPGEGEENASAAGSRELRQVVERLEKEVSQLRKRLEQAKKPKQKPRKG
jgi:polyhydroxyalkanoate synthesis repressor PhaR